MPPPWKKAFCREKKRPSKRQPHQPPTVKKGGKFIISVNRQRPKRKGHKNERLCLGCRRFFPKGDLLRVALLRDGQVVIDLKGRAGGRGAYVCPVMDCLTAAFKERRWAQALRKRPMNEQTLSSLMHPLAKQALWMTGDLPLFWRKGKASRQVSLKG